MDSDKKPTKKDWDNLLNKFEKATPTVQVGKNGKIANWKQLDNFSKEDVLEDGMYDSVDFSHSKIKYPALHKFNQEHPNEIPYW